MSQLNKYVIKKDIPLDNKERVKSNDPKLQECVSKMSQPRLKFDKWENVKQLEKLKNEKENKRRTRIISQELNSNENQMVNRL